ncbi:hypothetical protein Tco_0759082 [Tanacetum coccineum]
MSLGGNFQGSGDNNRGNWGRNNCGRMAGRGHMGGCYRPMMRNNGNGYGPPLMMHPQSMMSQGFDPSFNGPMNQMGNNDFSGGSTPLFSGMMPSFLPVGNMGLPVLAPHVKSRVHWKGYAYEWNGYDANGQVRDDWEQGYDRDIPLEKETVHKEDWPGMRTPSYSMARRANSMDPADKQECSPPPSRLQQDLQQSPVPQPSNETSTTWPEAADSPVPDVPEEDAQLFRGSKTHSYVNPAFFGRGMPMNGMGMMQTGGPDGLNMGMWSDPNMSGWAGDKHGARVGESSYGEEAGSDQG